MGVAGSRSWSPTLRTVNSSAGECGAKDQVSRTRLALHDQRSPMIEEVLPWKSL
jgi:hypothetical protein